ncbi:MAG: division/cell wall cluster transcriptional repressor MraZ [Candidatus Rokubacteria bacterium]|nr:division/cell wall cluster transcriptional repressor MraZ [Candidatus Rokubacteria bacterium]
MFRGRFEHTIDPKGRLSIPARFRDALAEAGDRLIVVPNESALEVHPIEEWERIEEKLNAQPTFTPEVRRLSRVYMSRAKEVALDGAGRILIPPDTRKQAGLDKDVTLVGGGRKMFEIWDRQRFDEYDRTEGASLPSLFEKLSEFGV